MGLNMDYMVKHFGMGEGSFIEEDEVDKSMSRDNSMVSEYMRTSINGEDSLPPASIETNLSLRIN